MSDIFLSIEFSVTDDLTPTATTAAFCL